jgi:hypothetical protein
LAGRSWQVSVGRKKLAGVSWEEEVGSGGLLVKLNPKLNKYGI